MKTFSLMLVLVFMVGALSAVQPVRKPFLQLKIDGKSIKSGDNLTVTKGQKLMIEVAMEGGRRDFCKFPDTYADIAGTAQILSRGADGLIYQLNGVKAEWKLLNEDTRFAADEYVQVKSLKNQSSAELTISNAKFTQSVVKFSIKAIWQFTQDGTTTLEENLAEGMVYFRIAGVSDIWFSSKNIQAGGLKNDLVEEKLKDVQSACDSIENNLFRLNFASVQQAIRNLQNTVISLKSAIDGVTAANRVYQSKIVFVGLPSDHPFSDMEILAKIMNSWGLLDSLVYDMKQQLGKLPPQPGTANNKELIKIIGMYLGWQNKLPENSFQHLSLYIPELKLENIQIPENLRSIAEEKNVADYQQTITDLNTFLDNRIQQIPDEFQNINSTDTRLKAVRLFDGMLRGYFSSINWAEWKNTRE